MKETIISILIMAAILLTSCSRAGHVEMQDQDTDPLPVKVLILPKLEVGDALYNSLEHFRQCIIGRKESLSGPDAAIRVLTVLEEADKNMTISE